MARERRRRVVNTHSDKKEEKKSKLNKLIVLLLLVLIAVVALKYGYFDFYAPKKIAQEKSLTILTVGTDSDAYRENLWDEDEKATLTDSLMVWTFNPATMQIVTTSIPRDTSVDYVCPRNSDVPDYQDQINELYYLSGYDIDCLEGTISNLLKVDIDYYVLVNMDQVVEIIDSVGPIKITAHAQDGVLYQEAADNDASYTWYDGETYEMMGKEAVTYARARHDSEKDYGRGLRQQQVIAATLKNVADGGFNIDLVKGLFELVETNMNLGTILQYATFGKHIDSYLNAMQNQETLNQEWFSNTAWKNIFDYYGYDENDVNSDTLAGFQTYYYENYDEDDLSEYFMTSYQFYNSAYSGHYNIEEDQLQEISDALRENLGLEPVTVQVPQKEYGDNEGSGLIPTGWAT